jgi:TfoX/Sxy family transcriptional regulator of competence genes
MGTRQEVLDRFSKTLGPAGPVSIRKMFGEAAVYWEDRVVALICDDRLFVKVSPISPNYLGDEHLAPPYPGAKPALLVPMEREGDEEWLRAWIRETAEFVTPPKKKR